MLCIRDFVKSNNFNWFYWHGNVREFHQTLKTYFTPYEMDRNTKCLHLFHTVVNYLSLVHSRIIFVREFLLYRFRFNFYFCISNDISSLLTIIVPRRANSATKVCRFRIVAFLCTYFYGATIKKKKNTNSYWFDYNLSFIGGH